MTNYQAEVVAVTGYPSALRFRKLKRTTIDFITFSEGLCAADVTNPSAPRDRASYLRDVIGPMVERGEIDDGSTTDYDDRKLRFSGATLWQPTSVSPQILLNVRLGVTHYKAFLEDQNRSDSENVSLQLKGLNKFESRYAFFSRAPGIAVLPITKEGDIFIGERTNDEAKGLLNAVAGHLKYREDPTKVKLREDLDQEMEEEFGIKASSVVGEPIFAGLYSHPIKGDLDFTFIVRTDVPSEYFSSGEWKKHVSAREHKELIKLASMDEIRMLLDEGLVPGSEKIYELMYSTRGALESLLPSDLE